QEAEEALQRRDRRRLASERRPSLRFGCEEAAEVRRAHQAEIVDSVLAEEAHAGRHVALVGGAGEGRQSVLDPAEVEGVGDLGRRSMRGALVMPPSLRWTSPCMRCTTSGCTGSFLATRRSPERR